MNTNSTRAFFRSSFLLSPPSPSSPCFLFPPSLPPLFVPRCWGGPRPPCILTHSASELPSPPRAPWPFLAANADAADPLGWSSIYKFAHNRKKSGRTCGRLSVQESRDVFVSSLSLRPRPLLALYSLPVALVPFLCGCSGYRNHWPQYLIQRGPFNRA